MFNFSFFPFFIHTMQTPADIDFLATPHVGIDDWQYEMRREIQEIIVNFILIDRKKKKKKKRRLI